MAVSSSFALRLSPKTVLQLLLFPPVAIPWLVIGTAMLVFFYWIGIKRGLVAILLGHVALSLPYVIVVVGARLANLLPGVWSARMPQKLRIRRIENLLEAWAEPFAALARSLGARDERAALRIAWRRLIENQAHDSICGCSTDRVHQQIDARLENAELLAEETALRALERLAGRDTDRSSTWGTEIDIAVFNPSAHVRTAIARFSLEPRVWLEFRGEPIPSMALHPWLPWDTPSGFRHRADSAHPSGYSAVER